MVSLAMMPPGLIEPLQSTVVVVRDDSAPPQPIVTQIDLEKDDPPHAAFSDLMEDLEGRPLVANRIESLAVSAALEPRMVAWAHQVHEINQALPNHQAQAVAQVAMLQAGNQLDLSGASREPVLAAASSRPDTKSDVVIRLSDVGLTRDQLLKGLLAAMTGGGGSVTTGDVQRASRVPQVPSIESSDEPVESRRRVEQKIFAGRLELRGGLALAQGHERIRVFREVSGQNLEEGVVDFKRAEFEIFVDQPVGLLVAELRNPHGHLIGRGEVEISRMMPQKDVLISMRPVFPGLEGRLLVADPSIELGGDRAVETGRLPPARAGRVQGAESPIDMVTAADGRFADASVGLGSSVLLSAQHRQSWSQLLLGIAGQSQSHVLWSDQAIQRVAAALNQTIDKSSQGVIYGRVLDGGRPVSGAIVQLAGATAESRVVYFNMAGVADPSLKETASNGLYVIVAPPPGLYFVSADGPVALNRSEAFPAIVSAGHTSKADIEFQQTRRATTLAFDAFETTKGLRAAVAQPGADSKIEWTTDRGALDYRFAPSDNALLIVDGDAGDQYHRSRVVSHRGVDQILLPFVKRNWLDGVLSTNGIRLAPSEGVVVGFVQGTHRYRVVIDDLARTLSTRVVYFNSRGETTSGRFGEPGGGFILVRVPEGFRTVGLEPIDGSKWYVSTVLVERGVVSIVNQGLK
jgi:hypothetical protein